MEPKIKVARICSNPPCENEIPKSRRIYCSEKCRLIVNCSKYYYRHKEKRLKYQKDYYEKNKERDKEKRKARFKKWRKKNRKKHNLQMRDYMREQKNG